MGVFHLFVFAAWEGYREREITEGAEALGENQEGQGWALKDREGQQRAEPSAGPTWGSLPSGSRQFTEPLPLPALPPTPFEPVRPCGEPGGDD